MVKEKKYLRPASLKEALQMAEDLQEPYRFLAGGTDLLVNKFQGQDTSACLVDISSIEELKQIKKDGKHMSIGPLVTLEEIQKNADILKEFPVLSHTSSMVGSPVIRKMATIGGNLLCENRCSFYNQSEWWRQAAGYCLKCKGDICIATGGDKNCFSKFSSDMAISLISLNAWVEILDGKNGCTIRLEDLYTSDGVNPRKYGTTTLLRSIILPLNQGYRGVFKKLRQRNSIEFSSLSTAVSVNRAGTLRMVLGGADPGPVVMEAQAGSDTAELIKKIVKKARTVDNDVYSRIYRKEMAQLFLENSVKELGLKK